MDFAWTKMDDFRKQELFVDVTFVVDGINFPAHKVVLSSQSTVLQAMFTSGMKEAQSGQVVITDIAPTIFEDFLSYFYTHAVPKNVLAVHLDELLYCAEKYGVLHLTNVCLEYLEDLPVVRRLVLADMYGLSEVKTKAAEEIARFGWDQLKPEEWFELLGEFRLTSEVLRLVLPSRVVSKWNITPDMWSCSPLENRFLVVLSPVHLRNNGRPCVFSVVLYSMRKTIRASLRYQPQHGGPKVVELTFDFSIGHEAHFCGKGDIWWDLDSGNREQPQDLFEHTFSSSRPIKDLQLLEFSLTLTQWTPPINMRFDGIRSSETVLVKLDNSTFEVNIELACTESDFFMLLLSGRRNVNHVYMIESTEFVNEQAFTYVSHYLLTGSEPLTVNTQMTLCARELGLVKLVEYCEYKVAQSLGDTEKPVDLLIFADQHKFNRLLDSTLVFIDLHLQEVVSSPDWNRLTDRPDLLYLIVKRLLASEDPSWSDGPDSGESETEVEAMMDRD